MLPEQIQFHIVLASHVVMIYHHHHYHYDDHLAGGYLRHVEAVPGAPHAPLCQAVYTGPHSHSALVENLKLKSSNIIVARFCLCVILFTSHFPNLQASMSIYAHCLKIDFLVHAFGGYCIFFLV